RDGGKRGGGDARQAGGVVPALPSGEWGRGGRGGRHRITGCRCLRSGGEPPALPEGAPADAPRTRPRLAMTPTAPWLEHYDHGVPATLTPYPDRTLLECVAETARRFPNHPAIPLNGPPP